MNIKYYKNNRVNMQKIFLNTICIFLVLIFALQLADNAKAFNNINPLSYIDLYGESRFLASSASTNQIENQEDHNDYNVMNHQNKAMNVLLGWSIASIVVGTPLAFQSSIVLRDIGIQSIAWGAIDGAIAIFGKNSANNKIEKGYLAEKEKQSFHRILLINTLLDIVYIGVGTALVASGKQKLKGHGYGVIIQGAFLFIFDGINLLLIP